MSNVHKFDPRKPKPEPASKRPDSKQRNALIIIIGVAVLIGASILLG